MQVHCGLYNQILFTITLLIASHQELDINSPKEDKKEIETFDDLIELQSSLMVQPVCSERVRNEMGKFFEYALALNGM